MMRASIAPKRSNRNFPKGLIEKIERPASHYGDYDPQAHYTALEQQCTESAAHLRTLIASTYGDEAEDVTERIVARYNDEIPDDEGMGMAGSIRTLQAIVDFYGKVTAEIRTAAAVPTVETPTTSPGKIELVVRYRTDGAHRMARIKDLGVLVEIREDGVKRDPKTDHVNTAFKWLAEHDYEPTAHVWLDKPQALVRREKITFEQSTELESSEL